MRQKRKWFKRIAAVLMAVCMLTGIVPPGFELVEPMKVEAAGGGVAQKINEIKKMYPDGSYFSVNGSACGHSQDKVCNNCKLSAIMNARHGGWPGGTDGWTCVGFARFVFYCIFGVMCSDSSGGWYYVSPSQAKIGDYVILNTGHAGICISCNGNNIYLYEANYATANKVRYTPQAYSVSQVSKVRRANNYDSVDTITTVPLTTPTISLDRSSYIAGDFATISWAGSSPQSDFYQYWLVIKNNTTGVVLYGNDAGSTGNVYVTSYLQQLDQPGEYTITVYAVPNNNKDTQQKISTKNVTVVQGKSGKDLVPKAVYFYNNHKYELYDERNNYSQALATAKAKGGYLAAITSQAENNAVMKLITASQYNGTDTGWRIGATDIEKEGTWKWGSGESFSYKNWNSGEPNNSNVGFVEDSAVIINSLTGKWNDVMTTQNFPFIVEYSSVNAASVSPAKTVSYTTSIGSKKYELYDIQATHADAQRIATAKGGNLVAINDATEMSRMLALIKNSKHYTTSNIGWYIGASDAEKEGTWKWDTGEAFSYKNWYKGEPNNNNAGKAENYAAIYNKSTGAWNDVTGNDFYGFIVEYTYYNELTTPTIKLNKSSYAVGDTAQISWEKSAENTDFYRYWIEIKNVSTGQILYQNSASSEKNVNKNSMSYQFQTKGTYSITVSAVPNSTQHTPKKSQTVTVTVKEKSVETEDLYFSLGDIEQIQAGETAVINIAANKTLYMNAWELNVFLNSDKVEFISEKDVNGEYRLYSGKFTYDFAMANYLSEENKVALAGVTTPTDGNGRVTDGTIIASFKIRAKTNLKADDVIATLNTVSFSDEVQGLKLSAEQKDECRVVDNTKYGDVNGDGIITAEDALTVLKSVAHMTTLTESQKKAADVNKDTSIEAIDALMILKYVARMIETFE